MHGCGEECAVNVVRPAQQCKASKASRASCLQGTNAAVRHLQRERRLADDKGVLQGGGRIEGRRQQCRGEAAALTASTGSSQIRAVHSGAMAPRNSPAPLFPAFGSSCAQRRAHREEQRAQRMGAMPGENRIGGEQNRGAGQICQVVGAEGSAGSSEWRDGRSVLNRETVADEGTLSWRRYRSRAGRGVGRPARSAPRRAARGHEVAARVRSSRPWR